MNMPCFQLKKLMAALLPMSFIWLFVACVSICVRESTEAHGHNSVAPPMEMRDASDCKGCPLTPIPKAIIPDRTIHGSDLQTPVLIPCFLLPIDSLADGVAFVFGQHRPSPLNPPLKRLPELRI